MSAAEAPVDRDGLLRQEAEHWATLESAIAAVPPDRVLEPGVVPGWSVRDVVWHCARWSAYVADVLEAIAAGTYVDEDQPEGWFEALNQRWADEAGAVGWDAVESEMRAARERARAAFEALADPGAVGAEWFTDETVNHYAEHAAEIAAFTSR
jgi:Mycothiol maleylpyruvate isomerase N-terminal domain